MASRTTPGDLSEGGSKLRIIKRIAECVRSCANPTERWRGRDQGVVLEQEMPRIELSRSHQRHYQVNCPRAPGRRTKKKRRPEGRRLTIATAWEF